MKYVGIWLDKEKAHIVTLNDNNEAIITVPSNIEHFHIHGGSGTRFKGGPQDVVQDRKYLEREKHQIKDYFSSLIPHLKSANNIVLFGPAQTADRFANYIKDNYRELDKKIKAVRKSDSMTNNEVVALVRNFFYS